jgi:gliding motility-associated-like protein
MNFKIFSGIIIVSFYTGILFSQSYSDGPIELQIKLREIKVTYSPPGDASLNFGGQVGFNPDEFTFKVWAKDNANISGLGWQGGTCLTDEFDPPLDSKDFNTTLFNYTYPSVLVPQYFDLKIDAWQDNCGSDGSSVGFPCPGTRCSFETSCCCVNGGIFGCLFSTGDNKRCNAEPFKTNIDYRSGPPCQWYNQGYITGSGCTDNVYQPRIETFWRYTRGTSCANPIPLGNILPGGVSISHFNSNECYSDNFTQSSGNDVFYSLNITQPIGLKITLCSNASFNSVLYLLNDSCQIFKTNDDACGVTSEINTALCTPGMYYIVVDGKTSSEMGTFTLTVSEDINQIVNADAGTDKSICFGNTVAIGGTPSAFGGVPGYTYSWSPAGYVNKPDSANPIVFPPVTTNFVLSATDSAGCTKTDTVLVVVNPGPQINLGNDTTICKGDSITLRAGAGYVNYFWSNGSNDSLIVVANQGNHYVSAIDIYGCIGRDTLKLSVFPQQLLNLGKDTSLCMGDTLHLNAGNFASYFWNTGSTDSSMVIYTTGIYSVAVIDTNTCEYFDTVSVAVNPLPVFSLGNDTIICPESTINIDPGGGYTSYLWSNGSNNQTLTAADSGMYSVKVSNTYNCFFSDSIYIGLFPQFSVDIGPDTGLCLGTSITINAGGGFSSYFWNTTETTSSIAVISGGTYWVNVVNGNSCMASDTIKIVQYANINASFSTTENVKCNGLANGSISVSVSGGTTPYGYTWSNGNSTSTEPNKLLALTSALPTICYGQNSGAASVLVIGGTTPYSYLWSNASTSATINNLYAGIYTVTYTDANNCKDSAQTEVFDADEIKVLIISDEASCTGQGDGSAQVSVSGGNSPYLYSWNNGATTLQLTGLSKGIYSVTVTDNAGCKANNSVLIKEQKAIIDDDLLEIPNIFTPNGDNINDIFNIISEIENIKEYEFTVFNRWGEKVFKSTDMKLGWDGKHNSKDAPEGVYYCTMQMIITCLGKDESISKSFSVTLMR